MGRHREARPRTPFAWAADCKRLAHLPQGRRPWTPIARNSSPSIPDIAHAIAGEERRQLDGVEMIPSENHTYPEVLAALGSVLTNKYSEGYPGRRYYGGQQYTDAFENIARDRACALFRATLAVHKIGRPPSLGRRRTSTRNEGTPRLNELELVKREGSFASRMTLPVGPPSGDLIKVEGRSGSDGLALAR